MDELLAKKANGIRRVFPWISYDAAKKIAADSISIYEDGGDYSDEFRSISEEEAKNIRPEDVYVTLEVSRSFYRLVHLAAQKFKTNLGMLSVVQGPEGMTEPMNVAPVCFYSEDGNGVPYEELPKPIKQVISKEISSVMSRIADFSDAKNTL